jgi:zinc protease
VSADLRPGVTAETAMAEIDRQIALLRSTPVSAEELQRAKNLEQAEFVFGQDSIFREAMMLGIYQALGDYRMVDQYLPSIDKVTVADVQRVAKKYLDISNRTVGVLVPTGELPPGAGGSGASGGAIRHSLPLDGAQQ